MEKVSVIIPMYNTSLYIEECINSVINQTYKNLEIIVIDDNSTDNSIEVLKKIKDKRIKIIKHNSNLGLAISRNDGIKKATGDYICFVDSDDYITKDKIEKQVNFMKDKAFSFTGFTYLKNNKTHDVHVPYSLTYEQAIKNTIILPSTVMFNMKYITKEEIYQVNLRKGQDTATWWRILKSGYTAYGLNEVKTIYRVNKSGLSANKFKALKRTWVLYKREDLNPIKRVWCYLNYIKNAIKKRI